MDIFSRMDEMKEETTNEEFFVNQDGRYQAKNPPKLEGKIYENCLPRERGSDCYYGVSPMAKHRAQKLYKDLKKSAEVPEYAKKGINFNYWQFYQKVDFVMFASPEKMRIAGDLGLDIEYVWSFSGRPECNVLAVSQYIKNLGLSSVNGVPFFFYLSPKELVHCLLTGRKVSISDEYLSNSIQRIKRQWQSVARNQIKNLEILFTCGEITLSGNDVREINEVCKEQGFETPEIFKIIMSAEKQSPAERKKVSKKSDITKKPSQKKITSAEEEINKLFEEIEKSI